MKTHSFGIPPWLKRDIEDKALQTMGENKASYLTKSYIDQLPASDQEDVREVKKGLGNLAGGAMQNPLGKFVSFFFLLFLFTVLDSTLCGFLFLFLDFAFC